jgi:hypothetical protein
MNELFARYVEALHPKFEHLLAAKPFKFDALADQRTS